MDVQHTEISALKPGRYMMMAGKPCEIVDMAHSKPGKHGHAKYQVTAVELLTGAKHIEVYTAHDSVEVPIIEKKDAQVLSISGDKAQLMDMQTYETFDADIPPEFKDKLQVNSEVVFWGIMDKKIIKQVKGGA
jgi:translation initiation factor 5A